MLRVCEKLRKIAEPSQIDEMSAALARLSMKESV